VVFQDGLKPSGFKSLIGKGHEEFSTMRQQDSEEFFGHLVNVLRRDGKKFKDRGERYPTQIFAYATEQRLQCTQCKQVRYRIDFTDVLSITVPALEKGKDVDGKTQYENVQLTSCIDALFAPEALDYSCPSCDKRVNALKQASFASFPSVLVVHAKKFQLVNWVPAKLDIPLLVPQDDILEFGKSYLGRGLKKGEKELPEDKGSVQASEPQLNETALAQLQTMGFPLIRCQKALLATGNGDAEAAMEWLFGHMDDSDIDAPLQPISSSSAPEPSTDQINMLGDMGFTSNQAKKALRETGGDMERAVEWLFSHPDDLGDSDSSATTVKSTAKEIPGTKDLPARYRLKAFISHKGPSLHSGHYVAHIRIGEDWVLFNDEKVVKADCESVKELKKLAYLYVFEKI